MTAHEFAILLRARHLTREQIYALFERGVEIVRSDPKSGEDLLMYAAAALANHKEGSDAD